MCKSLFAVSLAGLVTLVAGCASAPKTGEQPGLVIPPPPAHVVPITPEPVLEPVAEIPAPATVPPAGRGSTRGTAPPRSQTAERPDAKPGENKPADVKPVDQPPPETAPPPTPSAPAPQLRTADSTGTEANVHATIDRARALLHGIDYRHLTSVRKKAYDDALAFAQQAEDALKSGNVVFAQGVAAKAETLAVQLAGK
jgi:hypothetical protein